MYDSEIPLNSRNFQRVIHFYLFECPVRTFNRKKKSKEGIIESEVQTHPKYNYHFSRVSNRGVTFANRGLDGAKLNSFRAAMKRVAETDIILLPVSEIPTIDTKQEYLFILKNPENVSVTEGYFYCIRNALAHGSFDVTDSKDYIFVNDDKGKLKGMGRVKEKTLLSWIDLFNMDIEDIKKAGKQFKKRRAMR